MIYLAHLWQQLLWSLPLCCPRAVIASTGQTRAPGSSSDLMASPSAVGSHGVVLRHGAREGLYCTRISAPHFIFKLPLNLVGLYNFVMKFT
ncbi:hypothetical protein L3X38_037869 [Prunus dulcis]|uniref:Secreted protein n=1 Tax=Prunus dulcis TaxID=3755 RepID=A0AAD4V5G6_PRUDU|nr:hypothetical protein L3X38_037869 [Prunus dulcis]